VQPGRAAHQRHQDQVGVITHHDCGKVGWARGAGWLGGARGETGGSAVRTGVWGAVCAAAPELHS